ncbi:MAG: hypothetical protein QS98_C0011G0018 [archaeon GW2011_AR3]|nr:MAG: hypothetical protein QS98_C0011G0018 [archaeon GW2011_AR3]
METTYLHGAQDYSLDTFDESIDFFNDRYLVYFGANNNTF